MVPENGGPRDVWSQRMAVLGSVVSDGAAGGLAGGETGGVVSDGAVAYICI